MSRNTPIISQQDLPKLMEKAIRRLYLDGHDFTAENMVEYVSSQLAEQLQQAANNPSLDQVRLTGMSLAHAAMSGKVRPGYIPLEFHTGSMDEMKSALPAIIQNAAVLVRAHRQEPTQENLNHFINEEFQIAALKIVSNPQYEKAYQAGLYRMEGPPPQAISQLKSDPNFGIAYFASLNRKNAIVAKHVEKFLTEQGVTAKTDNILSDDEITALASLAQTEKAKSDLGAMRESLAALDSSSQSVGLDQFKQLAAKSKPQTGRA